MRGTSEVAQLAIASQSVSVRGNHLRPVLFTSGNMCFWHLSVAVAVGGGFSVHTLFIDLLHSFGLSRLFQTTYLCANCISHLSTCILPVPLKNTFDLMLWLLPLNFYYRHYWPIFRCHVQWRYFWATSQVPYQPNWPVLANNGTRRPCYRRIVVRCLQAGTC